MIDSIGIIGSGNTAWQMAHHFRKAGVPIEFVASRNEKAAEDLAKKIKVHHYRLDEVPKVETLMLCVTDSAIESVSDQFMGRSEWQFHCCGSVGISALTSQKKGVFYPLQTMTKGRLLGAGQIPICIESNEYEIRQKLLWLANTCGFPHFEMDSATRAKLHVSAVMVNNFVNHIMHHALNWADANGIEKGFLEPLAHETIKKVFALGAINSQTGPARRHNTEIIANHLKDLESLPNSEALYQFISQSIIKEFEGK